jgi:hypothetical protein
LESEDKEPFALTLESFDLFSGFPRKPLSNYQQTLLEAKLDGTLIIQILKPNSLAG